MPERRKELRYSIPEIYRNYISLRIKVDGESLMPASLLDFSRHGIKMQSPSRIAADSVIECIISIPASLRKEIGFKAIVRHCIDDTPEQIHIVGAEIVEIYNELWFSIFEKTLDFIQKRMGKVF